MTTAPASHQPACNPPCDGRGLLGGDLEQLELEHREDVRAGAVGARVGGQRLERAAHHALRRAPPADDLRVAQRELEAVHLARVRVRVRARVRVRVRVRVRARVRVGFRIAFSNRQEQNYGQCTWDGGPKSQGSA